MGTVHALPLSNPARPEKKSRGTTSRSEMPDRLSRKELSRLLKAGMKWRFTLEQVYYATHVVRAWHHGDPARRMRKDWVMVIQNAMLQGWGLRGFDKWISRGGQYSCFRMIDSTRDPRGLRIISPDLIRALLEPMD